MNVDSSFNIMSVCSGFGGLDIGIGLAIPNARTVVFVEREIAACAVLAAAMEAGALHAAPTWTNLETFDGKPWRGRVHCIIGGLPCQPFSVAGKRQGDKDERYVWPSFFRILEEVSPPLVFIENVPAITRWFRPIGERLCELGYRIEAGLFSASECGAPQKRERFFCLGVADSWNGQLPSAWWGPGGRDGLGSASSLLENPGRPRIERWAAEQARFDRGRSSGDDRGAGGALADAVGERSQGIGEGGPAPGAVGRSSRTEIYPYWPPGPADDREWESILERWPELSPAVADATRGHGIGTEQSLPGRSEGGPAVTDGSGEVGDSVSVDDVTGRHGASQVLVERSAPARIQGRAPSGSTPGGQEETEPEFRRLAAGTSSGLGIGRTDQLRGLGNLAIPITAAFAFSTLAEKLSSGGNE